MFQFPLLTVPVMVPGRCNGVGRATHVKMSLDSKAYRVRSIETAEAAIMSELQGCGRWHDCGRTSQGSSLDRCLPLWKM